MPKRSAAHSAVEFALVWPFLKALEWLPLPLANAAAAALGRSFYWLTPGWRRVARRNLTRALPELDAAGREAIVREVYAHLGRVLLSAARLPRLHAANIREWIGYEGFEHYERALERGRGVLFLTAHLGNWELSAVAHALYGHPMHVMVRPLDNPLIDDLLDRYRRHCGNRTIRKQDAARPVIKALRDNEAVGILIDQNTTGEDGVFVDFFGILASATSGLARLAMRTGATVLPGFALWLPDQRRYVLRFYAPLEMVSSGDDEHDLVANTQLCQRRLEELIRQFPEQWLWIHRRWKTRPPGEPDFYA